jgi:hypothetical protein
MPLWLTGLWGKVMAWGAIAAAIAVSLLVIVSKLMGAGRDKEKAAQAAKAAEMRRTGDEVDTRVDAAGPAERERLRNKWTRR